MGARCRLQVVVSIACLCCHSKAVVMLCWLVVLVYGRLAGGVYATLHGSDVVTRRMRVVVGRCVEVMGGIIGVVVAR